MIVNTSSEVQGYLDPAIVKNSCVPEPHAWGNARTARTDHPSPRYRLQQAQ